MGEMLPPLIIELQAKTDELSAKLGEIESKLKVVGHAAEETQTPFEHLTEKAVELAKKFAEVYIAEKLVDYLKEAALAAGEAAAGMATMSVQLRNMTGATDAQIEETNKQLEAMALQTNVMAADLRPAFEKFLGVTRDSEKAMHLLSLAQDIAAAKHKDLGAVTMALAKAQEGQMGALARLAPETKGAADAVGMLAQETKGAAAAAANADPYAKMQIAFKTIQESVGSALLPVLRDFANWLDSIVPKIQAFFAELENPTTALGKSFAHLVYSIEYVGQEFAALFNFLNTSGGFDGMATTINVLAALLQALGDKYKDLSRVMKDLQAGDFGGAAYWADQMAGLGAIPQTIKSITDALVSPKSAKLTFDTSGLGAFDTSGLGGGNVTPTGTDPVAAFISKTADAIKAAHQKYTDSILKANQNFADLVQKQITDFRDVFAKATEVNAATLFNQGYRSVDQMTNALQMKLEQANKLAADAARLSAAGYSAEFVKQVMGEGAVVGDQMAQSLLAASPEQAAKLQALYKQTMDVSTTGVNDLSLQITDQFTESTKALATAMNNAAVTLKDSLAKIRGSVTAEGSKTGTTSRLKGISGKLATETQFANQQIINVTSTSTTQASPQAVANAIVSSIKFGLPITAGVGR